MSGKSKGAVCAHGTERTENWKAGVEEKRKKAKAAKLARKRNRKSKR